MSLGHENQVSKVELQATDFLDERAELDFLRDRIRILNKALDKACIDLVWAEGYTNYRCKFRYEDAFRYCSEGKMCKDCLKNWYIEGVQNNG